MSTTQLETVIGLEIHVQLATRTKMFCGDVAEFGGEPNSRVCPVCLGLPGALPVANAAAVALAVRAAVSLGCSVHATSRFARKNYFYPDLPKGYQITQYRHPLATGGELGDPPVRIQRLHLEEDTGRSSHDRLPGHTAVDLNRAGIPLIEIVTRPDLRSPEQARAFLTGLKQLLQYLDVSDCDMEKGSLRVDANLSVRPRGTERLGTPTEIKNLNSFANVERALEFEQARQREWVGRGETVVRETLLWDADADEVRVMRSKEAARDYRYFDEPDLPPLRIPSGQVERVRDALPEMPSARLERFRREYALPDYDAEVLTASRDVADYFEEVAVESGDPKAASNWVMSPVLGWQNRTGEALAELPVRPGQVAELITMVESGTLSTSAARQVFDRVVDTGRPPAEIVEAEGLAQVRDVDQLDAWVEQALADHPDEAERLRAGEGQLVGFFMGIVMQKSGGAADPRRASELLRERAG